MITALTPHGLKQITTQNLSRSSSETEDLLKVLEISLPVSVFRESLQKIKNLLVGWGNGLHFQEKFQGDGLEILHFRETYDNELVGVGLPEKIVPLLKHFYNQDEILRTSGLWIRQGKTPLAFSFIESDNFPSLHPQHYLGKMNFVGLVAV